MPVDLNALLASADVAAKAEAEDYKKRKAAVDKQAAGGIAVVAGLASLVGTPALGAAVAAGLAAAWGGFEALGSWLTGGDKGNSDEARDRALAAMRRWLAYGRMPVAIQGDGVQSWAMYATQLERSADALDGLDSAQRDACVWIGDAVAKFAADAKLAAALSSPELTNAGALEVHLWRSARGIEVNNQRPFEPLVAARAAALASGGDEAAILRAALAAWGAFYDPEQHVITGLLPQSPVWPARWGATCLAAQTAAGGVRPASFSPGTARRAVSRASIASSALPIGGTAKPSAAMQVRMARVDAPTAPSAPMTTGQKVAVGVAGATVVGALVWAARVLRWL